MAIIEDMPNEILHNIVSPLGGQDLLATSLVSHSFYNIAQSLLYEKVYLYMDSGNQRDNHVLILVNYYQSLVSGSVPLFLRTMLLAPAREAFAHYVRTLTLDLAPPPRPAIPVSDIDLLTAAALNLGFDDHPLTEQDAQIILILHLLPRLTSLELWNVAQVGGFGYKLLQDMLVNPDRIPVALRNIRKFTCRGTYKSTGVTPQILVGLLGLPSIRKINVSITADHETETSMAAGATAAGTSPITKLIIYSHNITTASLASLLSIPKSLTYFCYTSKHGLSGTNIFDFWQAFGPLQSSLQYLRIYILGSDNVSPNEPKNRRNRIGTLREWKALHTLSLQLFMLLGVPNEVSPAGCLADLLPLGLRTLCVYDDSFWSGGEMMDQLIGVLERGEMVVLRKLSVTMSFDALNEEMVERVERLERACLMAGVELGMNRNGLY